MRNFIVPVNGVGTGDPNIPKSWKNDVSGLAGVIRCSNPSSRWNIWCERTHSVRLLLHV